MSRTYISEVLKSLRTDKKKTKKEVANHLEIDQSTYGKYELGKREPDLSTVIKLAKFFGVTTDYLLYGFDKKSKREMDVLRVASGSTCRVDVGDCGVNIEGPALIICIYERVFTKLIGVKDLCEKQIKECNESMEKTSVNSMRSLYKEGYYLGERNAYTRILHYLVNMEVE